MDIQWLSQLLQQTRDPGRSASDFLLRPGDLLTATVLDVDKGHDALLSFGPLRAYARLPLPVVSGQSVQIRVDKAGTSLQLVATSDHAPANPSHKKAEWPIRLFEPVSDKPFFKAHARGLVPGESLQGRITGFEKDGLQLVDFGKFRAFTKIDVPVRPGQVIGLTVVKSGDALTLAVNPSVKPGVPAPMPSSSPLVNMAGNDASAGSPPIPPPVDTASRAPTPVSGPPEPAGPEAPRMPVVDNPLRSQGVSPAPALPASTDMADMRAFARQLLDRPDAYKAVMSGEPSLPAPLKTALVNLTQALDPASPAGNTDSLIHRIRAFVENSGLYFEKRLEQAIRTIQSQEGRATPLPPEELARHPAIRDIMIKDLKPNLLILKEFLDGQELDARGTHRHALEAVKSLVQRAVSHLEQQQHMATEKPVDPDVLQSFSHLLMLTDTDKTARLKVYYGRKRQNGDPKKPRVSLLLEMDRMGMVRSDIWMVGRDLNITFFVQTDDIKTAIADQQHRIGEMLGDSFNTVAVNVVVNSAKIEAFDEEDLTRPRKRLLDVRL
jgi:hypothetical protein